MGRWVLTARIILVVLLLQFTCINAYADLVCDGSYYANINRLRAAAFTANREAFYDARKAEQVVEAVKQFHDRTTSFMRSFIAVEGAHRNFPVDTPFYKRAAISTARGLYNSVGRMLIPSLGLKIKSEVSGIFIKLWKDFDYKLTVEEVQVLRRHKALEDFQKRQAFLQNHPTLMKIRREFGDKTAKLFASFVIFNLVMAVNQGIEMAENAKGVDEYLEGPNEIDGVPVVQLLVETVPFPHTAIRIGNKVYSYGVSHMTAKTTFEYFKLPSLMQEEYLKKKKAKELMGGKDDKEETPTTDEKKEEKTPGSKNPMNYVSENTSGAVMPVFEKAMSGMPRSVRAVNLKLTAEEVKKLRMELEMNTGKRYANTTGVNDCSTMIIRALERNTSINVPALIDPFPSITASYLSLRKSMGDERIGKTELVIVGKGKSLTHHVIRNTYIAALEGKSLFSFTPLPDSAGGGFILMPPLAGFAYKNLRRTYIDVFNDNDDLVWYDPEVKVEIEKWKKETAEDIKKELYGYFNDGEADQFEKIGKLPANAKNRAQKIKRAKEYIDLIIEPRQKEALDAMNSPYVEFRDMIVSQQKLITLEQVRRLWLTQLGVAPIEK